MIELTKADLIDSKRKSSKGNQFKWYKNGYWYKADQNGYEGLSEYVVSKLLEKSNLKKDEFVLFRTHLFLPSLIELRTTQSMKCFAG